MKDETRRLFKLVCDANEFDEADFEDWAAKLAIDKVAQYRNYRRSLLPKRPVGRPSQSKVPRQVSKLVPCIMCDKPGDALAMPAHFTSAGIHGEFTFCRDHASLEAREPFQSAIGYEPMRGEIKDVEGFINWLMNHGKEDDAVKFRAASKPTNVIMSPFAPNPIEPFKG